MTRAPMGQGNYWKTGIDFLRTAVSERKLLLSMPSKNPGYDPQFCFDHAKYYLALTFSRYSGGDPIRELGQDFAGLLDAWELSNKLAEELKAELRPGEGWDHRHLLTAPTVCCDTRVHNDPREWLFDLSNLNHYNWCFWLVGLAVVLDVADDQWNRLLTMIGAEGEDVLLDRVIARRQPARTIASKLLHPKPYARLLRAIDAPRSQQAVLLRDFVDHWYPELAREGGDELWWYIFGDPVKHPLEMGSYFGRWCVEAVAAVKAFGLDDSLCVGHEHYPGDLLRPDGPSTHSARAEPRRGWLARLLGRVAR